MVKKITDEELEKCNFFCEKDYPRFQNSDNFIKADKKRMDYVEKLLKKKYTIKEIKRNYKTLKNKLPKICKNIYCNPGCNKKTLRYVSNNSIKNFNVFKKRGAITSCYRFDQYARFAKKLKSI